MDWRTALITFSLLFYVDGYSKYGRTCKDIGCLNSEVCVLAEDPCSFGHSSNCGTYPTCKKKSQVEGSHSEPAQPAVPKPAVPQTPTRDDSAPSYPAPAPPSNTHGSPYGSPYGGNAPSSPYGGHSPNSPSSPYGGHSPNSPYGGNSPNSPYGGNVPNSPYGGYGGNSNPGGSPYGGNPYGGSSNRGGSPYGGQNGGTGGKSPLDNIFNTLSNFANGGHGTPGTGSNGAGGNGAGLSNILGNILGNLSKNGGGINNLFNTRPIMENPNYPSYSSNSRSANSQTYPSGNQQPNQNRNYGQNYAHRSAATARTPSYGWNVSVTVILTYVIRQYIYSVIRD